MQILVTTPTRCGLIGGGTDVNPFASEFGGKVLSLALNLRMRAVLEPHKKMTVELESLGEKRTLVSIDRHLNYGKDPKFDLIRAIINYFLEDIPSSFYLKTDTGADSVMGLGSSGATAVAVIAAFDHWLNKGMSPIEMAMLAFRMETQELQWPGGKQDQLAAAYGGINLLTFGPGEGVGVVPLKLDTDILQGLREWSLMFFLGGYRHSKEQQHQLTSGMSDYKKQQALLSLRDAVDQTLEAVRNQDWEKVGNLLDKAWEDKKQSNPVASNEVIDDFYHTAKQNGMLGGKIMGSGGAGHLYLIIPPEKQAQVKEVLIEKGARLIDFDFDFEGVTVKKI